MFIYHDLSIWTLTLFCDLVAELEAPWPFNASDLDAPWPSQFSETLFHDDKLPACHSDDSMQPICYPTTSLGVYGRQILSAKFNFTLNCLQYELGSQTIHGRGNASIFQTIPSVALFERFTCSEANCKHSPTGDSLTRFVEAKRASTQIPTRHTTHYNVGSSKPSEPVQQILTRHMIHYNVGPSKPSGPVQQPYTLFTPCALLLAIYSRLVACGPCGGARSSRFAASKAASHGQLNALTSYTFLLTLLLPQASAWP